MIQVKNIPLFPLLRLLLFFIGLFIILNISLPSVNATICPINPTDNPCWVIKNPMPTTRRALGVAANLDGEIYAVGGYDGQGSFLNVLEKYSPETDTWSTKSPLPDARIAMGFTFSSKSVVPTYRKNPNRLFYADLLCKVQPCSKVGPCKGGLLAFRGATDELCLCYV